MTAIKTILFFLLAPVVYTGCSNDLPKEEISGVVVDSCNINVSVKDTANSVLDLIVSFETTRHISSKATNDINFLMQEKLSMYADSAVYMPVLCQPIATGIKNKYQYWVSFEIGDISHRNAILRISDNEIVRSTVNYKL
jgi:hypothetical protein